MHSSHNYGISMGLSAKEALIAIVPPPSEAVIETIIETVMRDPDLPLLVSEDMSYTPIYGLTFGFEKTSETRVALAATVIANTLEHFHGATKIDPHIMNINQ